jgi:hypothetical protein
MRKLTRNAFRFVGAGSRFERSTSITQIRTVSIRKIREFRKYCSVLVSSEKEKAQEKVNF